MKKKLKFVAVLVAISLVLLWFPVATVATTITTTKLLAATRRKGHTDNSHHAGQRYFDRCICLAMIP